jgi:hypothetical protein
MDAMLVHSSPIFVDEAAVIAELGREFRLPSIGLFPIYTKVCGFLTDGIILNCSSRLVASSAKFFVVRNQQSFSYRDRSICRF